MRCPGYQCSSPDDGLEGDRSPEGRSLNLKCPIQLWVSQQLSLALSAQWLWSWSLVIFLFMICGCIYVHVGLQNITLCVFLTESALHATKWNHENIYFIFHRITEMLGLEKKISKITKSTVNHLEWWFTTKYSPLNHILKCHSRKFLNTSMDGDSTTPIGSLFQCLITLSIKNFFSIQAVSEQPPGFWMHGLSFRLPSRNQELDSMIHVGPFQLKMFHYSVSLV